MNSTAITFDQLPHVVGGLSEKLDRVLELLEKEGIATPFNQHKPKRRIVYAKEACTIIGKSLSSLYRGIKPYRAIIVDSISMKMNCTHGLRADANMPAPQVSQIMRMP